MGKLKLATWNVNSLRARAARVLAVLQRHDLDVLALQELKCRPEQVPADLRQALAEAGYELTMCGLNQWNGVGIISRVGIDAVQLGFPGQPGFSKATGVTRAAAGEAPAATREARAIGAQVGFAKVGAGQASAAQVDARQASPGQAGPAQVEETGPAPASSAKSGSAPASSASGLEIWSVYVPNGRALDDPHYVYKLEFLRQLQDFAAQRLARDPALKLAIVGDWNVIPTDADVWDPAALGSELYMTAAERDAFFAFTAAGMREVTRSLVTGYTFWDYQQLHFPRNEGMRIDYVYASPALAGAVHAAQIDREERKGKGASDHVPVIVEFTW